MLSIRRSSAISERVAVARPWRPGGEAAGGTRPRWSPLAWVLVAGTLASPRPAAAFNLEEHLEIGRGGYLAACAMLNEMKDAASPAARRRLELACQDPENLAIHYGQFVGLSGDHVSIDQLGTVHGDIDAENLIVYLKLAIQNADHFFPANVRKYEEIHDRALDLAASAAAMAKTEEAWLQVRKQFWLAFYASAFADHFLQDTYAAGHGSFNRPASTPAASRGYHNVLNDEGMILRDAAGRIWVSYGDGKLNLRQGQVTTHDKTQACVSASTPITRAGRLYAPSKPDSEKPAHERGKALLIAASRESVRDVLLAFVTGKRSPTRELGITRRIPSDCLGSETDGCTIDATVYAHREEEDLKAALTRLGLMSCQLVAAEAKVEIAQHALERCESTPPPELERCWTECEPAQNLCDQERKAWSDALQESRDLYEEEAAAIAREGFWAPTLAAQDPAHLQQYVGGEWIYFGRAAPLRHLTGPAASVHFYTPLFTWGFRAGYYWQAAEPGASDRGLAVGMTVGVPLGTRYGSVISWEATWRPTLYAPYEGPNRITYVSLPLGAQIGIQLAFLTAGLGFAYAPAYAGEIGTAAEQSGWAHGWEGSLSLTWGSGVTGGGLKSAPPL